MVWGHHNIRNCVMGRSIRKVKDHWSGVYRLLIVLDFCISYFITQGSNLNKLCAGILQFHCGIVVLKCAVSTWDTGALSAPSSLPKGTCHTLGGDMK